VILALLGFLFVVLVAIGVPISFAVGAASVSRRCCCPASTTRPSSSAC
jgi:hypothetical protein